MLMKTKTKAIVLAALLVCLLGMSSWAAQRAYRAGWVPPGFATPEGFLRNLHRERPDLPYDPRILVPLRAAPWEDLEQKLANLDHRAQTLYGYDEVRVAGEIIQPFFVQAFPQARMYMVWGTTARSWELGPAPIGIMVTFKDKDYRMYDDFPILVLDSGYTYQDMDSLEGRQAALIAALAPWEVIDEVACDEGERIHEAFGNDSTPYVYRINCELVKRGQPLFIKFKESDPQWNRFILLTINRRPRKEEENNGILAP